MTAFDRNDPLLVALRAPGDLAGLSEPAWSELLRRARRVRLEVRIALDLESAGLVDGLPRRTRERLALARMAGDEVARTLAWEIGRIERALADLDMPHIYLKGAAYAVAELPPARGRVATDVDLLVNRKGLPKVFGALRRFGWDLVELDPYDERFYRLWSHELPPMRHAERDTLIDVHHTILPPTNRLKPNPALLLESARPAGPRGLLVLAPADMVLHSAAHLFQDGDLALAVRDLVDIRDLLAHFGRDPAFWDEIVARAAALELGRPLFYALRYARLLLDAPIPEAALRSADRFAPPGPVLALMDAIVPSALVPGPTAEARLGRSPGGLLLYMRSHWLRMPPRLLAAHLSRKAWMRLRQPDEDRLAMVVRR
ncbi:MAG: nucleotidyltransferase family protein [Alphaproteobacteria bacterium]